MKTVKQYYYVSICEYPENEDIMYCLECSKKFPTLEMAIKCKNIWYEQFNLKSRIECVHVERLEVN